MIGIDCILVRLMLFSFECRERIGQAAYFVGHFKAQRRFVAAGIAVAAFGQYKKARKVLLVGFNALLENLQAEFPGGKLVGYSGGVLQLELFTRLAERAVSSLSRMATPGSAYRKSVH